MRRLLFFLLFFILQIEIVYAQIDTIFWFAVPEASEAIPHNADKPIFLRIASYNQAATVTISQPAGGGFPMSTLNLGANSNQSVDLTTWLSVLENFYPDSVVNFGLKISSTAPISVYYDLVTGQGLSFRNNPEAFALKGNNALGTEFWIPSQNLVNNSSIYTPSPRNGFDIVATENNTTITITPSNNIVGHTANIPFNITLNSGQTYSAIATSNTAATHLQGSKVISDKPIAITVKDDLLSGAPYGSCADMAGEQIVPVNILGTEYIAINGFLNNPNSQIFVTATVNGTTISKDGTYITTINAGQTYQISIVNLSTYIQTSQPTYIWQLSGIGCELGATLLPHINCTGSENVSYIRSTNLELYANVVVPTGGENGFTINSNVVASSLFSNVSGTANQWKFARINLSNLTTYPLGNTIKIENSLHKFHVGVLEGGNNAGTSYGYFSDYGSVSVTAFGDTVCAGDTIHLTASNILGATYSWTGPNAFASNLQNPTIPNASVAYSGWYYLDVNTTNCSGEDSTYVEILPTPNLQFFPKDTSICTPAPIQLLATGATNYSWTPATFLSNPNIPNPIATPTSSITYYVTASIIPTCIITDSVTIIIEDLDTPNLIPDTFFCVGDTIVLHANSNNATSYLWSTNDTTPTISVYQSGQYWVTVGKDNCTESDTVNIIFYPYPDLQIYPNDTSICTPAPIQLLATGATNYSWTPATFLNFTNIANPVSTPTSSITYYVTASINSACTTTDSVTITIDDVDDPQLIPDTAFCGVDTFILDPNSQNATNFLWSTGDTTPTISIFQSGQYWVMVQKDLCINYDTVNITFYEAPDVEILNDDTTLCAIAPIQLNAIGATNYNWTPATFLNNPNIPNPIAIPTGTITYYLTAYDIPECSSIDSVNITIVLIDPPNLISDTTICEGDFIYLYANSNSSNSKYLWSTGDTTSSIYVLHSGQYWVKTFWGDCEGGADTVNVSFLPNSDLNILSSDTTLCSITPIALLASGSSSYRWYPTDYLSNPNIPNPIANPPYTITYYVTSNSSQNECNALDSITISIGEPPVISINAEDSIIVCEDNVLQLSASGAAIYHWRPENLCNDYTIPNPIVSPKSNTMFYVTGIDEQGCIGTDSIFVKFYDEAFVFVPNAFSPNNDGINDYFYPLINCGIELELFSVYNRFGELVFSTSQPNVGWDGLQNSKPSDVGVYFWYFVGNRNGNKVIKKGDVTLIK